MEIAIEFCDCRKNPNTRMLKFTTASLFRTGSVPDPKSPDALEGNSNRKTRLPPNMAGSIPDIFRRYRSTGPHPKHSARWHHRSARSPASLAPPTIDVALRPNMPVSGRRLLRDEVESQPARCVPSPRGEKDRMRGFGRWCLILKLPNPLTPPSPLWGEGDHGRRPSSLFR